MCVCVCVNWCLLALPSLKASIHWATFVVRLCCAAKVASCLELSHTQLLSRDKWQEVVLSFSYTLLIREWIHQIARNRWQICCWCFWCNSGCLGLMRECIWWRNRDVANGPGIGLGVNPGFEFITGWNRNHVSAMKQVTGIFFYVWMQSPSMNCWPWLDHGDGGILWSFVQLVAWN